MQTPSVYADRQGKVVGLWPVSIDTARLRGLDMLERSEVRADRVTQSNEWISSDRRPVQLSHELPRRQKLAIRQKLALLVPYTASVCIRNWLEIAFEVVRTQ
jgi:hypothetical protein